jgi:hypothetical protein
MRREGEGWRIGVITIKARGRPPHGGALMVVATSPAWAGEGSIHVTSVDVILKQSPLQAGGPTANVAGSSRAGNQEVSLKNTISCSSAPLRILKV